MQTHHVWSACCPLGSRGRPLHPSDSLSGAFISALSSKWLSVTLRDSVVTRSPNCWPACPCKAPLPVNTGVLPKCHSYHTVLSLDQFSSVAQSHPTLCPPMNRSTPGLPVYHQLPESTQNHVHWVSDAIQPSHPLSSPPPPALNLSQHQGLFQWVSSSHQVAKGLGVSASASVLPVNTQDWSPLRMDCYLSSSWQHV